MFKKESGITLVALVVTIIVLLILAGVSISMVAGENGIATKAKSAATKTDLANAQEAVGLAVSAAQMDYAADYAEGNATATPSFTIGDINDNLNGYTLAGDADDALVTGTAVDLTAEGASVAAFTATFTISNGNITAVVVEFAE